MFSKFRRKRSCRKALFVFVLFCGIVPFFLDLSSFLPKQTSLSIFNRSSGITFLRTASTAKQNATRETTVKRCPTGSTLRWLSFWDENRYTPEEFVGWANFGFSKNVSQILKGRDLGMNHILKVHGIFFERTAKASLKKGSLALRSDFQELWAKSRKDYIDSLVSSKAIMGFYLGDELIWQGLEILELEKAARQIRDSFPDAIVWYNEAKGAVRSGMDQHKMKHNFTKVPGEITWFSVDTYHIRPRGAYATSVRNFYENYVYPKLHEHQAVLVIPGAFGSRLHKRCSLACYDSFCSKDAWEFFDWAWEDDRVIGLAPYHWNTCPHCRQTRNEVGAKYLNKTRLAWEEIGRKIIASCKESESDDDSYSDE